MRVLLTGMSGTGKSTLVRELRTRGCEALDADDDGFTEPSSSGAWSWRVDLVRARFDQQTEGVLYFAGCSEEQAQFAFDLTVLLTAPQTVLVDRLRSRDTNAYGKDPAELDQVLADLRVIEPLLRSTADLVIDTTRPVEVVADLVGAEVVRRRSRRIRETVRPSRDGAD